MLNLILNLKINTFKSQCYLDFTSNHRKLSWNILHKLRLSHVWLSEFQKWLAFDRKFDSKTHCIKINSNFISDCAKFFFHIKFFNFFFILLHFCSIYTDIFKIRFYINEVNFYIISKSPSNFCCYKIMFITPFYCCLK